MKNAVGLLVCVALLIATSISTGQNGTVKEGALDIEKTPVPTTDARKESQKKIREAFAADFKAAKTPEQRWQLASKLSKEAVEIKDDPLAEYAFAMEAIDLYVGVGDALSAFRAVDELAVTFALNPITTKVDLFKRAAKEAKATLLKRMLALVGLKLAGDAAAAEDYVAAKEVAALSLGLAKPSRDASVIKRATEQQAKFTALLKQFQLVEEAQKKLDGGATDSDAEMTVGRYLCLVRQNWDDGLPHLSKGTDAELKTVAAFDLQTGPDAVAQAGTADAWWVVADNRKGTDKQQIMPRVAYWYEKAMPGLSGLTKVTAEKRLETAYEVMSGRNFRKIMEDPANGIQSLGTLDCVDKPHPANLNKGFDYRRSWLLSLQFSPPHLNGGWHMVMFWGDGRPGHDPLWLRQDGPWLHCVVEDSVNERGQGISALLSPNQINDWVDVKFVHDTVSQELELYINHRLVRKEALAITPQSDQEMNVVLGGTNDYTGQRFTGKVRNVWMGNIK